MSEKTLLDEKAAAARLGLKPKTLQRWRWRGEGPAYVKLSARAVRYSPEALAEFIETRTVGLEAKAE